MVNSFFFPFGKTPFASQAVAKLQPGGHVFPGLNPNTVV